MDWSGLFSVPDFVFRKVFLTQSDGWQRKNRAKNHNRVQKSTQSKFSIDECERIAHSVQALTYSGYDIIVEILYFIYRFFGRKSNNSVKSMEAISKNSLSGYRKVCLA
jgi:hypothetical protein